MVGPTLFRRMLGQAMDQLPAAVRAVHDTQGRIEVTGTAEVDAKPGLLPWLICAALGLPAAGSGVPVRIVFEMGPEGDYWERHIGTRRYASHFVAGPRAGVVIERMGAFASHFVLTATADRLYLTLDRCAFLGLPLPSWLAPRCSAEEAEIDGALLFDVPIDLPLLGRIIRYRGIVRP
ncbi:DUF4166 domain-containing protein [Elstera cyanobacteriorum]|nr:DUF4166 domain-containing protein [Elstera cyanobacteriorum]